MTETSINWLSADFSELKPLRPLSPEILDQEEFRYIGIDVDKLTRSEIAGKLLDRLDELHQEETEPFDWYSSEKSIDIPPFDHIPSPTAYKPENGVKEIHGYTFSNSSPKYESTISPPVNGYNVTQPPFKYGPPPSQHEVIEKKVTSAELESAAIAPDFVFECFKAETLTPPDSPKDEDLAELLKTFEPAVLDQLMAGADKLDSVEFDEKPYSVDQFSEKSFLVDQFSESGGSSPSAVSDSGLDDHEWTPPCSVRKASTCSRKGDGTTSRRRNAKPYSKPPIEERRQRKKEQNKNAATRYRLKKKAEVKEIEVEESQLQKKNEQLKTQLEDISREVRYLKSLMREVYIKKGLIK